MALVGSHRIMAISTRRVKTNIKKIDAMSNDFNEFTMEFSIMLDEHKHQFKKLKIITDKINKHVGNIVAFADQKKDPSAYNLFFKAQSSKLGKKGQKNGGPSFARTVSTRWNNLPENKKLQWYQKATRSGAPY